MSNWALQLATLVLRIQTAETGETIASLTETDFAERLSQTRSAIVAFVTPWCIACRLLITELERVKAVLAQQTSNLLVAQCDVSQEKNLARIYRALRTPLVLFFPDSRILAPGLQLTFSGQLQQANLLAFAGNAHVNLPKQIHSPDELSQVALRGGRDGVFVGLFRSPDTSGLLQELWSAECLSRHRRAFAFASWDDADLNTKGAENLWRWAGLAWRGKTPSSLKGLLRLQEDLEEGAGQPLELEDEAIVYVRSKDDCDSTKAPLGGFSFYQDGNSSSSNSRAWPSASRGRKEAPWREQLDAFCAWCERQVLWPVAIFDASRAMALDGTFDWLLFLFVPKELASQEESSADEVRQRLSVELERLTRFSVAACARNKRYQEVLPVLVPQGAEDIVAFRSSFGIGPHDPVLPLASAGGDSTLSDTCASIDKAQACPRRQPLFATVMFNTQTRRKYPAPGGTGWCPGDETALCQFTDAVLDKTLPPYIRSASRPPENASPLRVKEVIGSSIGRELLEPVAVGRQEVLLLLYAPFCSFSMQFFTLWRALAATVHATAPEPSGNANVLNLAQMDAVQNEHADLPNMQELPALLLCLPKSAGSEEDRRKDTTASAGGLAVRFVKYEGVATLPALLTWIGKYSAFAPPLLGVEGVEG
eukprot:TRINITY_DN42312_c0_g1_i1.p1 TRINITY_DN42312_c0_g1~~TRINITY_DN42312_c0_g1_i1.p1  ORF type:complete len:650 (+),score=105.74 TRINITY_DN42312_c0_g1_i1:121-2070(+)